MGGLGDTLGAITLDAYICVVSPIVAVTAPAALQRSLLHLHRPPLLDGRTDMTWPPTNWRAS